MTSGTSLVGIATFEQTTHAECVAKLLGLSVKTVTTEDCATSRCDRGTATAAAATCETHRSFQLPILAVKQSAPVKPARRKR